MGKTTRAVSRRSRDTALYKLDVMDEVRPGRRPDLAREAHLLLTGAKIVPPRKCCSANIDGQGGFRLNRHADTNGRKRDHNPRIRHLAREAGRLQVRRALEDRPS